MMGGNKNILESAKEEGEKQNSLFQCKCMGLHKKDQGSFIEESGNHPYENDVVRYIFRWQKFDSRI